ncbi:hypothetical protein ACFX1T_003838 [Malus domestica]
MPIPKASQRHLLYLTWFLGRIHIQSKLKHSFNICHTEDGSGTPEHDKNCPTSLARSVSCPTKICPTKASRASPRRKQKYDRYPQPTPFSQGSCVLVRQEIPATNKVVICFDYNAANPVDCVRTTNCGALVSYSL